MSKWKLGSAAVLAVIFVGLFAYRSHLMNELRSEVLKQLNDPESAQFRNERYWSNWTRTGGVLCGEVNAKNLMGGYTGYRTFVVFPGLATIYSESEVKSRQAMGTPVCDFANVAPWWHLR